MNANSQMRAQISFLIIVLAISVPALIRAFDLPTTLTISICGDGLLNSNEICDAGPGNNLGLYGSTTAERKCNFDCISWGPYCGDGVFQARFQEECDDGNNISGDLCSDICVAETPIPPANSGAPTVGSIPTLPGGQQGTIGANVQTRVVLRGKAYPNSEVNVLLDGELTGSVRSDSNADFEFTTTSITPGTATFGFWARDQNGLESITTSVVFEVVQSAVTTVANVFFPPTIRLSERQVAKGSLLTISGQSVPLASVVSEINGGPRTTMKSDVDSSGAWALQLDTDSLTDGLHTIKAYFEQGIDIRSGFGKSLSFNVGEGSFADTGSPDLNGDGKVNLIDFSIFLTKWRTDDVRSDFNADGTVNLADFSIMLFNWTG